MNVIGEMPEIPPHVLAAIYIYIHTHTDVEFCVFLVSQGILT